MSHDAAPYPLLADAGPAVLGPARTPPRAMRSARISTAHRTVRSGGNDAGRSPARCPARVRRRRPDQRGVSRSARAAAARRARPGRPLRLADDAEASRLRGHGGPGAGARDWREQHAVHHPERAHPARPADPAFRPRGLRHDHRRSRRRPRPLVRRLSRARRSDVARRGTGRLPADPDGPRRRRTHGGTVRRCVRHGQCLRDHRRPAGPRARVHGVRRHARGRAGGARHARGVGGPLRRRSGRDGSCHYSQRDRAVTLVGVMPDRSGFPGTVAVWMPLWQAPGLAAQARDNRTLQVFGRAA